jgi:signal transduction histidine kinase
MAQSEAGVIDAPGAVRRSRRRPRRVALGWGVFAGTTLGCAGAFALDVAAGRLLPLLYVAVTAIVGALGVLLTTRRPENRVSFVIAVTALWWAVADCANAYAIQALVEHPGGLPGGLAAAWLDNWAWLPGLTLFLCALVMLVPDGQLGSPRWWPIPAAVTVGTLLLALKISTSPTFDVAGTAVGNPLAGESVALDALAVLGAAAVVIGLAAAVASFVVRYRRSSGEARQQLRWVVASLVVAICLAVVGMAAWDVGGVAYVLPALALLAVPAGITVAVLRYRLYDLDLVVNRTLVYAALTAGVVAAYVLVVGLVGSSLSRRGDVLVSFAVTAVVAVCFQPARERVQRLVNRLMYGHRDDPYLALAGLSRILAGTVGADSVLPAAAETIGRTLALQYVAVALAEDEPAATYGSPRTTEMLVVPLMHHDLRVGELRLAPRPGERLRQRDRHLIEDLAPQVAAAVQAVALSRELHAARQRLVELREEERRRIRRDLHDGLGPALAGLTFTIDAARNLAASDAAASDRLLVSASAHVQELVADVRTLIEGLRPPAVDQYGLTASLRALAERHDVAATTVIVDAPPTLPALPAAVEVATYWLAQEALTNVRRHAKARVCAVRLWVEDGTMHVEVEDDGVGLGRTRLGLGLHTMRERAAELGGVCTVGPAKGGGTLVSAAFPLDAASP